MNKYDKTVCKRMIRQAMDAYRQYDRYYVAVYAVRLLIWMSMEAVLDHMPIDTYRQYAMRQYCDRIMSRLLDI